MIVIIIMWIIVLLRIFVVCYAICWTQSFADTGAV